MPSRRPGQGYRRTFKSGPSDFSSRKSKTFASDPFRPNESTSQDEKLEATRLAHSIDESMGFARYDSGKRRVGWLCNMHSTSVEDDNIPGGRAGVDYYFLEEDGSTFKATHLVGYRRTFLQLSFVNVADLLAVRKAIMPVAEKNKKNVKAMDTYAEVAR